MLIFVKYLPCLGAFQISHLTLLPCEAGIILEMGSFRLREVKWPQLRFTQDSNLDLHVSKS